MTVIIPKVDFVDPITAADFNSILDKIQNGIDNDVKINSVSANSTNLMITNNGTTLASRIDVSAGTAVGLELNPNTARAPLRLGDMPAFPTGNAEIGDIASINGDLGICIGSGTPGTWTSVGTWNKNISWGANELFGDGNIGAATTVGVTRGWSMASTGTANVYTNLRLPSGHIGGDLTVYVTWYANAAITLGNTVVWELSWCYLEDDDLVTTTPTLIQTTYTYVTGDVYRGQMTTDLGNINVTPSGNKMLYLKVARNGPAGTQAGAIVLTGIRISFP